MESNTATNEDCLKVLKWIVSKMNSIDHKQHCVGDFVLIEMPIVFIVFLWSTGIEELYPEFSSVNSSDPFYGKDAKSFLEKLQNIDDLFMANSSGKLREWLDKTLSKPLEELLVEADLG